MISVRVGTAKSGVPMKMTRKLIRGIYPKRARHSGRSEAKTRKPSKVSGILRWIPERGRSRGSSGMTVCFVALA
jgi:hypothetical protein